MNNNELDQLRRTSRRNAWLTILGVLIVASSLLYSYITLSQLETNVREKKNELESYEKDVSRLKIELDESLNLIEQKTSVITQLENTDRLLQKKINKAKSEFSELKNNIEQLYAVRVTNNNDVYELKAAAKATGQTTSNGPAYLFSVFINAPESTLRKISKVKYVFDHPTFAQKVRTEDDPETRFMTKYYGWGCLTNVSATLYLSDGETQGIDFNMCQSLGPQWWGENDAVESSPSRKQPAKKNSSRTDCGIHWASWDEIGGKIGNPCPPGCYRGEEVDREYRTSNKRRVEKLPFGIKVPQKIPSKLSRRQFQCWKSE